MPTIVYFVHGMGCGSADGAPSLEGKEWFAETKNAMEWIRDVFQLPAPHWMDSIPSAPPSTQPDAVWCVPVSYHDAFDTFRAQTMDRSKAALSNVASSLTDAQITRLTQSEFAWKNCLDVLLWWSDRTQARPTATTRILEAITKADALARPLRAPIRRILISHSLGTAAATEAMRFLGQDPEWRMIGGMDVWLTLANVAPFLIPEEVVYSPPLLPRSTDTVVRSFLNVRHQCDPIPWLLPWRHHTSAHAGASRPDWDSAAVAGRAQVAETAGVAAPPNGTPEISHVHGFGNYLMNPAVAQIVAGAMRGQFYSPAEIAAAGLSAKWNALPQLSCVNTPGALNDLAATVSQFTTFQPPGGERPASGWFERLLDAADLLMAAKGQC